MSKIYDGIMGLIVGDALGVPFEFKKRDTFKAKDMIGYGTYNQPPGTWSDDSSMTLATLDSLARNKGKIDLEGVMQNFYRWLFHCEFTPYNDVFDVGGTTHRAINLYVRGYSLNDCGGDGVMDNGNGALMRILPLAFIPCSYDEIKAVSRLTHAHPISVCACLLYISIARKLIQGEDKEDAIFDGNAEILALLKDDFPVELHKIHCIQYFKRDEIKSSGYVVDTLEAALWCLCHTNTYRNCVLTAVNLGSDTDTVAAVAGGLAGIYYGCGGGSGVPDEWIAQIPRRDWIKALCDELIIEN